MIGLTISSLNFSSPSFSSSDRPSLFLTIWYKMLLTSFTVASVASILTFITFFFIKSSETCRIPRGRKTASATRCLSLLKASADHYSRATGRTPVSSASGHKNARRAAYGGVIRLQQNLDAAKIRQKINSPKKSADFFVFFSFFLFKVTKKS